MTAALTGRTREQGDGERLCACVAGAGQASSGGDTEAFPAKRPRTWKARDLEGPGTKPVGWQK